MPPEKWSTVYKIVERAASNHPGTQSTRQRGRAQHTWFPTLLRMMTRYPFARSSLSLLALLCTVTGAVTYSAPMAGASSVGPSWAKHLWSCDGPSNAPHSAKGAPKIEVIGVFKAGVTKEQIAQAGGWVYKNASNCVSSFYTTTDHGRKVLSVYAYPAQIQKYQEFIVGLLEGVPFFSYVVKE